MVAAAPLEDNLVMQEQLRTWHVSSATLQCGDTSDGQTQPHSGLDTETSWENLTGLGPGLSHSNGSLIARLQGDLGE